MTLDKHQIDGIGGFSQKVMSAKEFEKQLIEAGYEQVGNAPAKGRRIKAWWTHTSYRRLEIIYSPDQKLVITAYHPS